MARTAANSAAPSRAGVTTARWIMTAVSSIRCDRSWNTWSTRSTCTVASADILAASSETCLARSITGFRSVSNRPSICSIRCAARAP